MNIDSMELVGILKLIATSLALLITHRFAHMMVFYTELSAMSVYSIYTTVRETSSVCKFLLDFLAIIHFIIYSYDEEI
jgi:regulator of sigma D